MAILEIKGVTKHFGGTRALEDVTITIERGGVNGLIGPNGSGKSTLINIVSGFLLPDSGKIIFKNKDITGLPPYEIFHKGICRDFQISDIRSKMTILENMILGRKEIGERLLPIFLEWSKVKDEERRDITQILPIVERVHLKEFPDEPAETLSGGQRKLLSFGRILAADPELFLLDEPMAGVNPTLANTLVEMIRELARSGKTFVIVEHNMQLIRSICDRVYVLAVGKKIAEGSIEEIQNNEDVLRAYLSGKEEE